MNLRASYRYQLADHKKSILIFYFVIICAYLLFGILGMYFFMKTSVSGVPSEGLVKMNGSLSGFEVTTVVFLFVSGLNSFKENFGMLTQNGISRRSLFAGRICVIATVALFITSIDKIWYFMSVGLTRILGGAMDHTLLMDMLYNRSAVVTPFALHAESFAFNLAMYCAALCAGYLTTVVFYRMNKLGKAILGAGAPVLFLIILPILDRQFFAGQISVSVGRFLAWAFGFTSGNPLYAVAAFFVFSVIALMTAWLVMRRASLHE